jgi:hypothetical protein
MAGAPPIQVEGLKQFGAFLKSVDPKLKRQLGKSSKAAADIAVPIVQQSMASVHINAMSGKASGKVQAKVAPTVRSVASTVAVQIAMGKGMPYTRGALLGALPIAGRFGSKRRARFNATGKGGVYRQFPVHVGNSWVIGQPGGPYGIGPGMEKALPRIKDKYLDGIKEVLQSGEIKYY